MTARTYLSVAISALMITSNAMAFEQKRPLPADTYDFISSIDRDFTAATNLSTFPDDKIYSARRERLAFTVSEFSDPSVPRNRLNFGYAFNRAFYTPLHGSLAVGYLATYNSETSQDTDAYYGQQGASNTGSSAWILDYKFTGKTSIALIHTNYYFSQQGSAMEHTNQTGLYFGIVF